MNIPVVNPDFFPHRINNYVPMCQYSAAVGHSGQYRVSLGTPVVADADGILDGAAADDTGPFTYTPTDFATSTTGVDSDGVLDAPFGRDITAVGSAAGVTQDLTVVGFDYLGQKITKTKAMNGTTPIALGVAFKRIESITIAVGAATETIDVGWGDELGLPFKTTMVDAEFADDVLQSAGTLTAPVLTDPQTASTADPRGLYNPNATLDGSTEIVLLAYASADINSDDNGGLFGIAHHGG